MSKFKYLLLQWPRNVVTQIFSGFQKGFIITEVVVCDPIQSIHHEALNVPSCIQGGGRQSLWRKWRELSLFSKAAPYWKTFLLPSVIPQLCCLLQHKLNSDHTMEIQIKDESYSCVHCNLSFKVTKDLKMHMLQHGGKKSHPCNQCGYSAISASKLKIHMLVHSGENPFVCKQCNYSCTSASNLKRHMLTHSGEKPFSCTQCNYSCTTTESLKKHVLTHTGEKPFTCAQCDYSCTSASHLKTHMRTHSGEKPFMCEKCNYSCTKVENLKTHKLKHTREKPFKCKQCSFSYSSSSGLKYHMFSHTGEKPFACKQCNYACKIPSELKRHMRKHSAKTNAWKTNNFWYGKYHVCDADFSPTLVSWPDTKYTFLSDPGIAGLIDGFESLKLSERPFADLTDVTLADEDTNSILREALV